MRATPNKPSIRKWSRRDWLFHCPEHGFQNWTFDWLSAMEAAYGHIAMHHPIEPLFRKYPFLRDLKIPEDYKCCYGCAAAYVAELHGWPIALEWEGWAFAHKELSEL